MKCLTIKIEKGERVIIPKKQFDTLDLAIEEAKRMNLKVSDGQKLVSYRCERCFKFHIGRNGKQITEKYKQKLKREYGR